MKTFKQHLNEAKFSERDIGNPLSHALADFIQKDPMIKGAVNRNARKSFNMRTATAHFTLEESDVTAYVMVYFDSSEQKFGVSAVANAPGNQTSGEIVNEFDPNETSAQDVLKLALRSVYKAVGNMIRNDYTNIRHFKNPSKKLQQFAVSIDPRAIVHIENPDPDLQTSHGHIGDLVDVGVL